jgi:hypothetical protein
MLGSLLIIAIIAGFALAQYLKGGIVKGFVFLMAAIIGSAVAFAYYEMLAGYVKDYGFIGAKGYPIAFLLLFVLVFAVIREVANKALKSKVSFGGIADKVGGAVIGVLVGYVFAGAIFVTIGLTPYRLDWLYGRFDDNLTNPPQPSRTLLNPDGFLAGLFGTLSNGSLKGANSFTLVHADYLDQIFLNSYLTGDGVFAIAENSAVSMGENGARLAPENLMLASKKEGQATEPVGQESGKTLTLVQLQVNSMGLVPQESEYQPKMSLAQLRVVTKDKQAAGDLTSGSGEVVYPIGYLNAEGQLVKKQLGTALDEKELKSDKMSVAFEIPQNQTPVLMEFRQNIIWEIGKVASANEPPPAQPSPAQQPVSQPNEPAPAESAPAEQQ